MLSLLKIQNLALVDTLLWNVEEGLTAITGETGAGKSVIIGALKLLAGARADKTLIRTGTSKAQVEAVFCLRETQAIDALLKDSGMEPCQDGELVLRRILSPSSTKQFVNDTPCSLGLLKQLGAHLMDLHGPHDHQSLLSAERQLELVTRFIGAPSLDANYAEAWESYSALQARRQSFEKSEILSEQELDLYRYQRDEIAAAALDPEALPELEEHYQRASNAAKLSALAQQSLALLSGDRGLLDQINDLLRCARELEAIDSSIRPELAGVDTLSVELQELEGVIEQYLSGLETDPAQFATIEQRVDLIESLKRKYGGSVEKVIEYEQRVAEKLASTEKRAETLQAFQTELAEKHEALSVLAREISEHRRQAAPKIARQVQAHLKDLGFERAVFEVQLIAQQTLTKEGMERVEFQFGPNLGEPTKPLHQIASSGEMSRVMLALKTTLAKHDEIPLLVFDEIDANVGGEIASAVGRKMQELSQQRQVLSITHFPQVAVIAPHHCLVSKHVSQDRTCSILEPLIGEAREREIVRMLGSPGAQAEALARSMLHQTGAEAGHPSSFSLK